MSKTSKFSVKYFMESTNYEIHHLITEEPFHITYHNHDFFEVFLFLSGNVKYMIEGIIYNLKPGDILLTHNKEMHKPMIDFSLPYERIVLWLHPMYIKELEDSIMNLSACFEHATENQRHILQPSSSMYATVSMLFRNLINTNNSTLYGDTLLSKCYLTELLVHLNRLSDENLYESDYEEVYDPRMKEIITYINHNLNDTITLDELAAKFYLSKYHLCRLFKKKVGLTIYQYIIKKRLIIAKSLLISGASVKSAYISSGFSDYSNFMKSFKAEFGISPKHMSRSIEDK